MVGGIPSVITRVSGTDPPGPTHFELIRSSSWCYIILVLSYTKPIQMSIYNFICLNPLSRSIHTQDYPLFSLSCSMSRARDGCASQSERPPASRSLLAAFRDRTPDGLPDSLHISPAASSSNKSLHHVSSAYPSAARPSALPAERLTTASPDCLPAH